MKYLFLDDYRNPEDCLNYMAPRVGPDVSLYKSQDWSIVRNYPAFVEYILKNGLPDMISFDHDLADVHYHESMYQGRKVYMKYIETTSEKTGYHCAQWLVNYCIDKNEKLPAYIVHSMNPVGAENIMHLLENFKRRMYEKIPRNT